jgi:hypothetical protein
MPRFDPTEFGRLTPQELRQAEGPVAEACRGCPGDRRAGRRRPARAAGATHAPGGAGPEQAHSDGVARGAERRGQAAAGRLWPGSIAPIRWSRWRVT